MGGLGTTGTTAGGLFGATSQPQATGLFGGGLGAGAAAGGLFQSPQGKYYM